MTDKPSAKFRPLRTFGRTGGRGLSARQQSLIDNLLPQLEVPAAAAGSLTSADLFGDDREVWLEIGFGGGEHIVGQAARHPETGFIGCEPFIEGMAKALSGVEEQALRNVRLVMDDVRPVLTSLADGSVSRVFILFPDPWPKKRQQKRRLIQPEFLKELHRVCCAGARVRFATDVKSYADEALWHFLQHGGFAWGAERADDWRLPPADHLTTRYESKKLGDCDPVWFDFETQLT